MPDKIRKTVVVEVTEGKPYNKCIQCDKLGSRCDGPNFTAMTPDRMVEWIRLRKEWLGWTNAMLSERSAAPKGTVDRILAGGHADFKMSTIAPIIKALVGGTWGQFPCPDPEAAPPDVKSLLAALEAKEKENAKLKESISTLEEKHEKELKRAEEKHEKDERYLMNLIDDLKSQVSDYKRLTRKILMIIAVLVFVIILALMADRSDPSIGFIWRSAAASISQ